MASVSSCEYKVCRSIGRESHFRFSLWLCLPRSSSDLHPTASPPATPAGGTPPPSQPGCHVLHGVVPSARVALMGARLLPGLCRAQAESGPERGSRCAWQSLTRGVPAPTVGKGSSERTIPQGRFLFGFLVCGTRLKIVIRSSRGVPTGGAPSNSFRQSVLGGPRLPACF